MKNAVYIGPIQKLKQKCAIIKKSSNKNIVLAQFDDLNIDYWNENIDGDNVPICYGWHAFSKSDFCVD